MEIHSDQRIFVAGHRGMVGSAIVRRLNALGCRNIITRTRQKLDLLNQSEVNAFFAEERVDQVISLPLKWVAFTPITAIRQSSSTRI